MTKLPMPIPPASPFYPAIRVLAEHPASLALPVPDSRTGIARAFDAIVLTDRRRRCSPLFRLLPGPQAVLAIVG